jgi:hypothetical protein
MAPVDCDVVLGAKVGNGELRDAAPGGFIARPGNLDRPTGIGVPLGRLRWVVRPDLGSTEAGLDLRLLLVVAALARRRCQRGIDDLPAHRDVAGGPELGVESLVQPLDGAGIRQAHAEQPDGILVRCGLAIETSASQKSPPAALVAGHSSAHEDLSR